MDIHFYWAFGFLSIGMAFALDDLGIVDGVVHMASIVSACNYVPQRNAVLL